MLPIIAKQAIKVDFVSDDLTVILAYLQDMIRQVGLCLDNTYVSNDVNRRRVRISNFRQKSVIACYKKQSLIRLLGLTSNGVNLKPADRELSNAMKTRSKITCSKKSSTMFLYFTLIAKVRILRVSHCS